MEKEKTILFSFYSRKSISRMFTKLGMKLLKFVSSWYLDYLNLKTCISDLLLELF